MLTQPHFVSILLATSVLLNLVLVVTLFITRRRRISDHPEKYILLLNLLEQRIVEYQRLYELYKTNLDKRYQVKNPSITYSREAYANDLQKYVNELVKQLLSEFSRDSRAVLLQIFSEEGLIRYVVDKIAR